MERYYLGLDMGTSTVGWAVTDERYNLIRKKGKDLWGVREFEEAQTAVERRTHRISRRRRQREQVRIGILKNYFAEAIENVDSNFYARLSNSKYHLEDKDDNVRTPNGIFSDKDFTDKDYFEKYPTIFHLRKELINNPSEHDVRLVFLALLNMYKHRGHFLNAGVSSDNNSGMEDAYLEFKDIMEIVLDISFAEIDSSKLENILGNRDLSRTEKSQEICALLGVDKKQKQEIAIIKTICGLKSDAKILFKLDDLEEKVEIEFSSFGYEEKEPMIHAAIGDQFFEVLNSMKKIYDIGSLSGILRGNNYLSEARVKDYEKHANDLKILKTVMKQYASQTEYDKMFRYEDKGSYSAYVNSVSNDKLYAGKHRRNMKGRKRDDFYAAVKTILKRMPEDDNVLYIKHEIELETFMPKQLSASNGVIPYQVHSKEMKAILRNAKEYLPFLNDIDDSGLSVADRIIALFEFQIPYYIGPVTENSKKNDGNGWVVRKEAGEVLPWNINNKIDKKKTSEEFILRMIRKCTYIHDESVLPKNSLLYESYCVLNEINNLRIDNERISVELKQEIYNDLFKNLNKVTKKKLVDYLLGRKVIDLAEQVSGVDTTINNSLGSYRKFKAIFGDEIETDQGKKKIEDIILWCTLYGDAKEFLKQNIEENYPEVTPAQIKRICGIKFKDWGRFSKQFLELQGYDKYTGEKLSIIRALWETSYNLMELIHSDNFTFAEALEEKQHNVTACLNEFTLDLLDEYYFSAPVKKMIWQTLGIIKEVEELIGGAPDKIFIEMTRTDEEKGDRGRKSSRKQQLLALYSSVKEDNKYWKELIERADQSGKLRSKKMYLYITQMGKDMYTGKSIDLDDLFDDNLYDIDHIYPRHFVKDDSIHNNLVLVSKTKNAHKSDVYPIEATIRNDQEVKNHWAFLRSKNLISEEKYRRLTGSKAFSEDQQADFIARQMVETGQATKGIADILKQILPESEIVYAKAGNVSRFRTRYGFLKSRAVNDFHHANDAYLNIVVGNVYLTKFTNNPRNFIKNEYSKDPKKYHYNLYKMFEKDVIRNGEVAWIAQKEGVPGTLSTVIKVLKKNTPIITKAVDEVTGTLYNIQPKGKRQANSKNYVALKSTDIKLNQLEKYGGYTSLNPSYFIVVEHGKKGKRKRTFESVPVIMNAQIKNKEDLTNYCKNNLGLENPRICVSKIKKYSLIKLDGAYLRIVGMDSRKNVEYHNAISLCLTPKYVNYIKKIGDFAEKDEMKNEISIENNMELYDELIVKHQSNIFKCKPKPLGEVLLNGRKQFSELSLKDQCIYLLRILDVTRLGSTAVDLKKIGGSGEEGRMRISGNITNREEVLLIHQSKTGVYESVIDLLKV